MIRKRLGRFATVLTAASMALLLLGAGGAVAKTPSGWGIAITNLPATVKAGNVAGYDVTISNIGPSNVNAVTFTIVPTDTPNATPAYFPGLSGYQCTTTGQVVCDLGTMAAGTVIHFQVAYNVPTTSSGTFDVSFQLKSGSGYVPGNNQSRGDAYANVAKTSLSASQNFDGGFTIGATTFQTGGSLGRNNKQTTQLDTTDLNIPVTVTDGIDSFACNACTTNVVGEWSVLDVNSGNSGPIKVTIMVWGGSVPGSVSASSLYLIHANPDGTFNIVNQQCDSTHSNADCLAGVPVKVGNNYKIVAWLAHNGGIRGGF